MDSKIYEGQFWLPDHESIKIYGNLKISLLTGEAFLNLVSPIDKNSQNGDRYELIYGFSTNGRFLSLQDCIINESPSCSPGLKTQKISVEKIYIRRSHMGRSNYHYDLSKKIEKIIVGFTYLNDWVDTPLFELDISKTSDNRYIFQETYTTPKEHLIRLKINDLAVTLRFKYGFGELGTHYINSPKIITEHYFETALEIETDQPLNIESWFDLILNPIRELITLGTLMPNWVSSLSLVECGKERDSYTKFFSRNIVCKRKNEKLKKHEMLFCFNDIQNNFNEIMMTWFEIQGKAKYLLSAFFSTLQSNDMYLEHHFLTLAQVGEAYHRVFGHLKEVDLVDKKGKREPFFKERFEELLQTVNSGMIKKIIPEKETFLDMVRDTRNALSHLDIERKKHVANYVEMQKIIHQLNALLFILILDNLKISYRNVLSNFYRYYPL